MVTLAIIVAALYGATSLVGAIEGVDSFKDRPPVYLAFSLLLEAALVTLLLVIFI